MPSVLLVSPYLPPHIGGVERYVETIANELVGLGWRVVIATPALPGTRTGTCGSFPDRSPLSQCTGSVVEYTGRVPLAC